LTARTSHAIVLEAPRRLRAFEIPIPETGDDEFLLRVEKVTICGGDPIEYEGGNRKAHYPLLLGHEVVGRIARIGTDAARRHGVDEGARVVVEPYIACGVCDRCRSGSYHFCRDGLVYGVTIANDRPPHLWGAYSEYLYGPPGARLHAIREDVPADAACLTSVIANGVRWVRTRGRGQVGEPVLVLGAGAQGLATIIVSKEAGLAPIIVVARSRNPAKLELARRFGADIVVDAEGEDVRGQIAVALDGRDLGLAVECTGSETMIELGVAALGPFGRLVLAGTRGGRPAPIDIDGVVFKELEVLGGLGQAHDTELAAQIVNSRRYPIEDIVTHTFPLDQAEDALRLFMDGRDGVIHVGLDPQR
jgi:threonine dehydrogenase-like Zn-dependent dehydrogenase